MLTDKHSSAKDFMIIGLSLLAAELTNYPIVGLIVPDALVLFGAIYGQNVRSKKIRQINEMELIDRMSQRKSMFPKYKKRRPLKRK